jgi:ABC-2 type transport system ATP-binding protein
VLVSSHLMSEMQQTADRLIVIGRGRLIADTTTAEMLRGLGQRQVRVRSSESDALSTELRKRGLTVARADGDELHVEDSTAEEIGALAHALNIPLHHIAEVEQSLEHAYRALTGSSVEYHGRLPEDAPAAKTAR